MTHQLPLLTNQDFIRKTKKETFKNDVSFCFSGFCSFIKNQNKLLAVFGLHTLLPPFVRRCQLFAYSSKVQTSFLNVA